ncbi:MAG TPA: NADH-quinone oxidoreductase subunit NuoB [Bdellovibrionota bacterium]|nr:NADH-quinone oxidoreductase subunit NuoB [Bdellovibrionota bacterium]
MFDSFISRFNQKYRTIGFPKNQPHLPERFRGKPEWDPVACARAGSQCRSCAEACPTDAITSTRPVLEMDLGKCLFCTECGNACPQKAIRMGNDHELSVGRRDALLLKGHDPVLAKAEALKRETLRIFGRSLKLRQVSAGGCNGCEVDINVLNTIVFDLGRFGIQFVASPRHADGIVVTGPVTANMKLALQKTYDAVPAPKFVIAVGACAISGGPFRDHPEVNNGAEGMFPIDLYIPGCPPHPITILDGLLRLIGRKK